MKNILMNNTYPIQKKTPRRNRKSISYANFATGSKASRPSEIIIHDRAYIMMSYNLIRIEEDSHQVDRVFGRRLFLQSPTFCRRFLISFKKRRKKTRHLKILFYPTLDHRLSAAQHIPWHRQDDNMKMEVYWWNALFMIVSLVMAESEQDETIQCICTTSICQEMAEPVCTTSGLCYSQYLDRRDGTNPVTKGCVNLKTPLLCENRPPKSASSLRVRWPILLCCRTQMCNKEDLRLQQLTQIDRITGQSEGAAAVETGDNIEGEGATHVTTDRNGHAVLTLNNNNQAHNNHNSLSNPTVMISFYWPSASPAAAFSKGNKFTDVISNRPLDVSIAKLGFRIPLPKHVD
uniref:Activin types I and II receptor domain-containing protein n=1 Tax=Daphnia galeata TaxID=27404 RepID=A0A8J2WD19_9CRUS|nr:unnamed protein product [Daphnia galeata]